MFLDKYMEVMIIVAACRNLICSVHDRFERSGKKRAIPFSKTSSTFWATRTYLKDCFLFTFCCPFDSGSRSNFRTGRLNINYCPAHSYTTSLTQGKTISSNWKKERTKLKLQSSTPPGYRTPKDQLISSSLSLIIQICQVYLYNRK